ncbi:putative phosphatase regulatory subunit-domain-containing protein [Syncephalastrum racemosum]|uniref:Putative phosphatase regulatory subunit-domain-containing protein n=1 Tax=Syncephalastrum racemosum TaxID=13706 RepID=A0A1X2H1X7_SYNRA|nr:putative phosphatase regulatory subunit-domain-containing protein [Syncephalastrum racemosum]
MTLAPSFSPPNHIFSHHASLTSSSPSAGQGNTKPLQHLHQYYLHHHSSHTITSTNTLVAIEPSRRRVTLHKQTYVEKTREPRTMPASKNKKGKSVRFCDTKLENIRFFLKTQKPSAVRLGDPSSLPLACPSCREQVELKYPNWPTIRTPAIQSVIRIESLQLDKNDNILLGRCRVANLAFEKHVTVRYTTDYWKSFHETEALYREPIGSSANTWDRFSFTIRLDDCASPNITVYLALKYTVNDNEFWDNNDGANYQVDVILPSDCHHYDNEEDNEAAAAADTAYHHPTASAAAPTVTTTLKKSLTTPTFSKTSITTSSFSHNNINSINLRENTQQEKKLGHRYDFGASLSAAKRSDTVPSRASPLQQPRAMASFSNMQHLKHFPSYYYQQQEQQKRPASPDNDDDDDGSQTRYHDFVNKYCFYGNSFASPAPSPPSFSPCPSPEPICS